MNIFIRSVPPQVGESELRKLLKQHLRAIGCYAFEIDKFKNGTFARLCVPYEVVGQRFLHQHGLPLGVARDRSPLTPLVIRGSTLQCTKDRFEPDAYLVKALQSQDDDFRKQSTVQTRHQHLTKDNADNRMTTNFGLVRLDCGVWQQRDSSFAFRSFYTDQRHGTLILGKRNLAILLNPSDTHYETARIDVDYHHVESVTVGLPSSPAVTLTLHHAPKFSKIVADPNADSIANALTSLSLYPQQEETRRRHRRVRTTSLHQDHITIAGSCFVYRLLLSDPSLLGQIKKTLASTPGSPGCITWPTSMCDAGMPFRVQMLQLLAELTKDHQLDFTVKFQIQRLAHNGYMTPDSVLKLLPAVRTMTKTYGDAAVVDAIISAALSTPYAGPNADPSQLSLTSIMSQIATKAKKFNFKGTKWDQAQRHTHLGMIHRVVVTPTGLLLEGPNLETKNRVLRKYPTRSDYFLRASFADENANFISMFPDPKDEIYRGKFQSMLNGMINICGRGFMFLGFSHSSIRARQCWFMAPFTESGSLKHAQEVIKDLGDFSEIRSPAKCAARIGQAFSDATHTIPVNQNSVHVMPDVERNGFVFTDGVGTISADMLKKVWKELDRSRNNRATCLQIRFQGAKGMLSLDERLTGEIMCLRKSMVKFPGSKDMNLEICGAAYKPLPLYLNRQYIKILEDLGVPAKSFLDLQEAAVKEIQSIIKSPINAAIFLERQNVTAGQAPTLIRLLKDVGLDFRKDKFLWNVVEAVSLVQMRDMKHRARIPVKENAHLLYGVSDESGSLQEGEVYVVIRDEAGRVRELLGGKSTALSTLSPLRFAGLTRVTDVIVSRSPALHPGDIQFARAVTVPDTSMLKKLQNCIVFSQQGERDLPSNLSGGDLDGDEYAVIFEPSLWPKTAYTPAAYTRQPAIDIEKLVTTTHMTDFFVTFMESDQLGHISNVHVQVADQKPEGTLSTECIVLAKMASTAVDFAKTGHPVDMAKMPKNFTRYCKPDFMAEAPRMLLGSGGASLSETIHQIAEEDGEEGEADAVRALEPDSRRIRYYRSDKVLGQLFRAIDVERFKETIRGDERSLLSEQLHQTPLIEQVWDHIQRTCLMIHWEHRRWLAREISDIYYESLIDTAYSYSPDRRRALSEVEVYSGIIQGRDGGIPNKRVRESNIDMRDKFNRDAANIIEMIVEDEDGYVDEAIAEYGHEYSTAGLERSIACVAVSVQDSCDHKLNGKALVSFRYLAAAVCLTQIEQNRKWLGHR